MNLSDIAEFEELDLVRARMHTRHADSAAFLPLGEFSCVCLLSLRHADYTDTHLYIWSTKQIEIQVVTLHYTPLPYK